MKTKELRGRGAAIVAAFAERQPPVFTLDEATALLRSPRGPVAQSLGRLASSGRLMRHRRGVYEISPLWSTPESPAALDRLSGLPSWLRAPYYVGFLSACELYGWLRQPVFDRTVVAVTASRRPVISGGSRISWVVERADRFDWGIGQDPPVAGQVVVSDRERTVVDILHLPRHVGGVVEAAEILVAAWASLDHDRLVDHAARLGIGAVTRRLGFLIERLGLPGGQPVAERLLRLLNGKRAAVCLEPSGPSSGPISTRWGVRTNVGEEELDAVGRS